MPPPGRMPRLHLIEYQGDLRLCEDVTGLLVGPTDRRLHLAGIYATNVRGERYYAKAAREADLRPGRLVRLVPEPDNPHDPNALAVYPEQGPGPVGYVNKAKARSWSKVLAEGVRLRTITLRGTGPGRPCDAVAVLAADPKVIDHLLSPRPIGLPTPVFLRSR
ncbi:HIRAN domain-containing protein [Streptomyces broussonetiae]|uniref:HIRAN domain-containing protein n=1 Tax=Streptomyces broussonetiae TaxID=2686304 RepID=UPI0018EEF01F|nr:HIRAN domain-containing protein [Streptomyces broussonetiae]